MTHSETMDRIYHFQRHFYDASRKLFLFGRDALLEKMDIGNGELVLEMGCGTARNLLCLAKKYPNGRFFGIDASEEMLAVAMKNMSRAECGPRISVKKAYAEDFHYKETFELEAKFDHIFFSYSLSMMPSWKNALDAAFLSLAPDGLLYVVDFYDQANWPKLVKAAMMKWLSLFHVHSDPGMIDELARHYAHRDRELEVTSILSGYAFLAAPRKR